MNVHFGNFKLSRKKLGNSLSRQVDIESVKVNMENVEVIIESVQVDIASVTHWHQRPLFGIVSLPTINNTVF